MNDFPLELDHIFIWTAAGARDAAAMALESCGLRADPNVHEHAGQGTSSVVFCFENAYLELIWVTDPAVAGQKGEEMGTDLIARADWRRTGASPFGVGLRRRVGFDAAGSLFPTREYRADWMSEGTFIHVAESSAAAAEPLYFIVPGGIALPPPEQLERLLEAHPEMRRNFVHPSGVRRLTGAKLVVTQKEFSRTSLLLAQNAIIGVEGGESPSAELTFDGRAQGKSCDLGPALPLTLKF